MKNINYIKRADVTVQSVDDETLILDLKADQIHQLNSTASFIWQNCNGKTSAAELAVMFAEYFGMDIEIATKDVETIINQFIELGLIEIY